MRKFLIKFYQAADLIFHFWFYSQQHVRPGSASLPISLKRKLNYKWLLEEPTSYLPSNFSKILLTFN
jgi:hypothetical protein